MASSPLTHVILGDGVAGMSAARVIRARRPHDRILIVSNDPQPYYYRAALTNYLMGELSDGELWAMPADYWEKLRFDRVLGEVAGLDAAARRVRLADGRELPYDRLLIATGARAQTLKSPEEDPKRGVPGANFPGVSSMRTLADVRQLIDFASRAKAAVVLGGGILGLEVCHGLKARNVAVTLIHRGQWLMERVVNRRAGELIHLRMLRDGIDVRMNTGIERIHGSTQGITAVDLTDGARLRTPLVVASIGIAPNTEWLRGSSVKLERDFIAVDRRMRVAGVEHVWSAGDVASFRDPDLPFANPSGLWQPAGKQGQIAGLGMTEEAEYAAPEYHPGVIYNATRAWDLDLGTLGDHVDGEGSSVVWESREDDRPIFKQALIRDGHVVGAMLLGDRREGHALRHLMNLKGEAGDVSAIADRLFSPDFDLPAWVASRASQQSVARWKQTAVLPAAPLPPGLAAGIERGTQLQLAVPTPAKTLLSKSVAPKPITVRSRGEPKTYVARLVRIGRDSDCDVRVDDPAIGGEELRLSLEGDVWIAYSTKNRHVQARSNGASLDRPRALRDGDFLALGTWTGVVELPAAANDSAPAAACGVLRGAERHLLSRTVTTVGAHADNDLVLSGPNVSPFHAQIHRAGEPAEFYAVDAGSQAGVFVNGKRLFAPRRLAPQDVVSFGGAELVFEGSVAPVRREPAPPRAAAPKTDRPVATLQILGGPSEGRSFTLPLPGVVGRSSTADIVLDDSLLSGRHAAFSLQDGRLHVVDLKSTNGVFLDDRPLTPGEPTPVDARQRLRLGRHVCRVSMNDDVSIAARRESAEFRIPGAVARLDCSTNSWQAEFPLTKDVTLIGRDLACDVVIPDGAVSRRHARIERTAAGMRVFDLESAGGTRVNGRPLAPQQPTTLVDGDALQLGGCRIVFRDQAGAANGVSPQTVPPAAPPAGFRIDWGKSSDPLSHDLRKTVQEELDSCIGCHDCMRACPLPDSSSVSIGALNSYATGLSEASPVALRFIEQCTQCQACVPVCPVDIQRSRIVLWNKLKQSPDPHARPWLQFGREALAASWTLGQIADSLAGHRVLGALSAPERLQLLANARFRRLVPGERLIEQGVYPDAVWFILEGRLEAGMATAKSAHQCMVLLGAGQSVGETAVLSDQPSELSVRAADSATVLGLPKYVLKTHLRQNSQFRRALEALYVSRSLEFFVRRHPAFAGAPDSLFDAMLGEFSAERYSPGQTVLAAADASNTFALVRRGFISEVRSWQGAEIIANYLKEGESFGWIDHARRGTLLRFDAATLVEVFTIRADRLARLETHWPPLRERLYAAGSDASAARPGQTQIFQKAACEGLLQATQLMVIDVRACVDCDNCVSACERRHGSSRLDRSASGLQIGPYQVPASCFHCDDPVCLLCAVDGIVREPSGEIRIVADNCIGCGACAERCPYDNIQMVARDGRSRPWLQRILPKPIFELFGGGRGRRMEDFERVAVKCDLCAGYSNGPACVRSCPTGAAQRVNPLEFFRDGQASTS